MARGGGANVGALPPMLAAWSLPPALEPDPEPPEPERPHAGLRMKPSIAVAQVVLTSEADAGSPHWAAVVMPFGTTIEVAAA